MKVRLIPTLLSAAAALSMSATAYAQEAAYAHVPFSFAMNGKILPAGNYRLSADTKFSNAVLSLNGTTDSAFAIANPKLDRDTRARLVFRCSETTGCALAEVWNRDGRGWSVPMRHLSAAQEERLAVVYLDRKSAE